MFGLVQDGSLWDLSFRADFVRNVLRVLIAYCLFLFAWFCGC